MADNLNTSDDNIRAKGELGEGFSEALKQIPEALSAIGEEVKECDKELDDAIGGNAEPDFMSHLEAKKRAIEEYQEALMRFKDAAESASQARQKMDGLEITTQKLPTDQNGFQMAEARQPDEKAGPNYSNGTPDRAIADANENRACFQELNASLQQLVEQIKISWPPSRAATTNANDTAILNSQYGPQLLRTLQLQGQSVEGLLELWEQLSRRINDARMH